MDESNFYETKQLRSIQINYCLEVVSSTLFCNNELFFNLFNSNYSYKVKKFLGSGFTIDGSGFLVTGPSNFSVVFISEIYKQSEFLLITAFYLQNVNGIKVNGKISIDICMIENTCENSTFVEFRVRYSKGSSIFIIEQVYQQKEVQKLFKNILEKLKETCEITSNKLLSLSHSLMINLNYEDLFFFHANLQNYAKSLGVDKDWKITLNGNLTKIGSFFKLKIKSGTIIKLTIEEFEKNDDFYYIVFKKTNEEDILPINNYIKCRYINISKNKSLLIHEITVDSNTPPEIVKLAQEYYQFTNKIMRNYLNRNFINKLINNYKL